MRKPPVPVTNFILSVTALGLIRALAWFFLGLEVEKTELWSVLGVGATGGLLYQALPKNSQQFITTTARQFLSNRNSTGLLSILVAVLLLPGLTLSHVEITWRGPNSINLQVNSTEQTLTSDESSTEVKRTRKYGFTLSSIGLNYGSWNTEKRMLPFIRQEVRIPFWITVGSMPQLREVEEQLEMSFFQFFEARFLTNAKNKLSALVRDESQKQAIERLDFVYQILRLSFLETDASDNKAILIGNFIIRYPDDQWTPLLHAAKYYAEKNYLSCADSLKLATRLGEYPKQSTVNFFRGVCLLKASRDAKGEEEKKLLSNHAIEQFQLAQRLSASDKDNVYRNLALPSSINFQGISYYYRGETDETIKLFTQASEVASGSFKARALNGIGYIQLSRGNLEQAEVALLGAMESDPTYPLARSNYGYVLLAKQDLKTAQQLFLKNASDERLKVDSYRDVVLARLALVHLAELNAAKVSETISQYEPILAERNIQDFGGVTPDELRLANIHRAIAKSIYLSKEYYGMEIYALALLTRAYMQTALLKPNEKDIRVTNLLDALSSEIATTKVMVSHDWLSRPQKGWFATIDQYQKTYEINSAQPITPRDAPQAARP